MRLTSPQTGYKTQPVEEQFKALHLEEAETDEDEDEPPQGPPPVVELVPTRWGWDDFM